MAADPRRNLFSSMAAKFGIGLTLAVEVIIFSQLSPYFFTAENILNVSLQLSITAIIAAGMTFVILTSGIDLSVGALVALTGVVSASIAKISLPVGVTLPLAIAAGLTIGALSGAFAGVCVTRFSITPFIATLALMTIFRGAAYIFTDGRPIWELPSQFSQLAGGRVYGIPYPTLIMAVVFAVAYVVLKWTRFGRHVYAVGGNKEAARLAGIDTDRVLIGVYVICGVLTSLSGILLASRVNSGQPNAGLMYELDVIAAVVVGGTSLAGGRGSIVGTLLGAVLIGVLRNGLNLLDVNSYVQQVVVGFVILITVMIDQTRKK
ncbi:MAG TPA: ribose ABC transporter permease [Bacteroidota bacterium]|nr:ribose ABC transporter permease [Bacteroidota bacterium]